jgi:hypothetical protein
VSLEARKLEVMQQLLLVDSEEVLDRVQHMLNAEKTFVLSDEQKAALDEQEARYKRGEGSFSPLEETLARIKDNYAASRAR